MKFNSRLRVLFYKIFGKFISSSIYRKRTQENKRTSPDSSRLEKAFKGLETSLRDVTYPSNEFNKIMSMVLSDLELFEFVSRRFRNDRAILGRIHREDNFLHTLDPKRRSYPVHSLEHINNYAIRVDVQSLFIFGIILVNRLSLLLKMYLPDRSDNAKIDMYSKIGILYSELNKNASPSQAAQKFKTKFLLNLKWLYSTLRFYRNEFIEHLDKGYQQGMNFGVYTADFALTSYKWDYDDGDNEKVEKFRVKLGGIGINIPGRSDGGRSLINRYYIQSLFDNIVKVPDPLLAEALDLIEEVGVHSPQPEKVIKEIEDYVEGVLNFMAEELELSALSKFKKSQI